MRVPTRLPMGGHTVRIDYVDVIKNEDGSTAWGETLEGPPHIQISTSKNKNEEEVWGTLYHELCHVALGLCGLDHMLQRPDGMEESIVCGLEHMLAQLVRLNPEIPGAKYKDIEFEFESDAD